MFKLLKFLIKFILTILIIVIIGLVGGCIYLNSAYGINVIDVFNQLKIMNEEINENEYIENKFSNEDLDSSKNISSLNNVINKNGDGTYTIDPDKISMLEEDIYLTDKQIGAIVNEIFKKEMEKNGQEYSKYNPEVKEVTFSNITPTSTYFTYMVKLDCSSIKEEYNTFPFTLLKNYIPNYLYLSMTSSITHLEKPFSYEINYVSTKINKLTDEQTSSFLNTIKNVTQLDFASEIYTSLSTTLINLMIGNENYEDGFTYSLSKNTLSGVKDYTFKEENGNRYYVIKRGLI